LPTDTQIVPEPDKSGQEQQATTADRQTGPYPTQGTMLIGRMKIEWSLSSSLSMPAVGDGAVWLDGRTTRPAGAFSLLFVP